MNEPNKAASKTLSRITAGILTVAFLGFVFAAFAVTLIDHHHELLHSVQMTSALQSTLPENAGALDRLSARITSFTSAIADNMWLKEGMGYVNSGFQYALGKRVINTGSQNMITLTDGHLYDLTDYRDLTGNAMEIVAQRDAVLKDTPFLFVYEHPTLYAGDMLPAGYEALDHSARMADEALAVLRENGVRTLDSRDVLPASPYPLDELLMVTDQHWSTLAAITMAQAVAGELNAMTGAELDPSALDLEVLNTLRHERLFIGKYGQRVGPGLVTPDDIVEYWPRVPTRMTRDSVKANGEAESVAGEFREVMTRADRLEPEPGKTWNTYAYTYYGQVEYYDLLHNADAPDFTVLLLKDSYSAPVARFLSLLASDVIAVDLRRDVEPLSWWVENYRPDAVVMAYSLQMLRDDEYEFG